MQVALDTSYPATVARIAQVIPVLADALQHGIELAHAYWREFEFRPRHHPQLWSHIARTHALEQLTTVGLVARPDEDAATPSMSALLIEHGTDILKVRLSHTGEVPTPGPSVALTSYYRQQPQLPGMETNNLLVLWSHRDGRLVEPLTLVRPLDGGRSTNDLVLAWTGHVDRRVASLRAADLEELRPLHEQRVLGSDDSA